MAPSEPEVLRSAIVAGTCVAVSASTCTFAVAPGGCRHLMRIDGYSRTKQLGGCTVHACTLHAGGHAWCILYLPNGDPGTVCFGAMLDHHDGGPFVTAQVRFTLVPARRAGAANEAPSGGFTEMFKEKKEKYVPLATGEELEKPEYLADDGFTVRCDIDVLCAMDAAGRAGPSAGEMERAGMLCGCKNEDGTCKYLHARDCVRKEKPSSCWSWLFRPKGYTPIN